MIAKNLVQSFPFVSNYFGELLSIANGLRFPQSIVFEGLDAYAQCFFALELARVLNCEQDGHEDCQCLNCRWIRENKHPALNFISQVHYKSSDDDSKTVISVIQAKNIEKSLRETSDYHRFFIFFDAKATAPDENQAKSLQEFAPKGYNICPENDWSLNHINAKTFNPSTPNILLKSVEEPPERTTFVFLTKNRSDLINTIVSRSQCFKLPALQVKTDFSDIKNLFLKYPNLTLEDALLISENLQNRIKDLQMPCDVLLDSILAYLTDEIRHCTDGLYLNKLQEDIKYLAEAKKQLSVSMSDRVVLDALMLKIARGTRNE